MNFILDTHTILWLLQDPRKIPALVASSIDNDENRLYISVASLWEFSIKYAKGRLTFTGGLDSLVSHLSTADIQVLPIKHSYLQQILQLPYIHSDPFDRIIIATAIDEKLQLLTSDNFIQQYSVDWLWS
jgi:PIN domain nuclease of toxin-antitoxin system